MAAIDAETLSGSLADRIAERRGKLPSRGEHITPDHKLIITPSGKVDSRMKPGPRHSLEGEIKPSLKALIDPKKNLADCWFV